jgi:two-component system NarL family sensor kinase
MARELHDSVGQLLAAISMNISVVRGEAHKLSPAAAKCVSENAGLIQEVVSEIRTISHLLHPPLLDEAGLAEGNGTVVSVNLNVGEAGFSQSA